jgi:hypothetical protein
MLVIHQKMIYRSDIKANPHVLYIFGDNLQRIGHGGQAKEMRGEPNSFGIATKRRVGHGNPDDYFFDGQTDITGIIDQEFFFLREAAKEYKAIVIPTDGIGTGLSRMPEFAPLALEYINKKLKELEEL